MEVHQSQPLNSETKGLELVSNFITPTNLFFHRNHDALPVDDSDRNLNQDDFELKLSIPSKLKRQLRLGIGWNWKCNSSASDSNKDDELDPSSTSTQTEASSSSFDIISLSISQLKSNYKQQTLAATLECAGNRRSEFDQEEKEPKGKEKEKEKGDGLKAEGIQWRGGVLGCCVWQGESISQLSVWSMKRVPAIVMKDPSTWDCTRYRIRCAVAGRVLLQESGVSDSSFES